MIPSLRFLILLSAGITLGYGLRVGARSVEVDAGQSSSRSARGNPRADDAEQNTARQKTARPFWQDVTLTREQWSRVLQFPHQYRLRLSSLREPGCLSGPAPYMLPGLQHLYGWSDAQTSRMGEVMLSFKQAVDTLEAERSTASYPEPGKVLITYGPMAEEYRRLTVELRSHVQEILGEARSNKFLTVSDFNGLAAERGPDSKQEITFALDEDQNMQITSLPRPHGINRVMITGRSAAGVFDAPATVRDAKTHEPVGMIWDITIPTKIDMRRVEQEVRKQQIRKP